MRVILFTRKDCCLCGEAKKTLDEERQRYRFELSVIDVDTDPELIRLYGEQVPVVAIDGKVRFRGVVNRVLLRRLLRGFMSIL